MMTTKDDDKGDEQKAQKIKEVGVERVGRGEDRQSANYTIHFQNSVPEQARTQEPNNKLCTYIELFIACSIFSNVFWVTSHDYVYIVS